MISRQDGIRSWDRWKDATSTISGGFETRFSGTKDEFRGTIQRFQLLGLSYASIETNARGLYRGITESEEADRHFCLVYQGRGRSVIRQSDGMAVLNPSDMVLLSPDQPCEFINKGVIRQLSFRIKETILREKLGDKAMPILTPIRGDSGVGALLSALLTQIHSRSGDLRVQTVESMSLPIAVASLLTAALETTEAAERNVCDRNDAISTMTVLQYVDTNLRNSNLSPAYIAKALGCSARHVHRAFEGTGTTATSYIRERRLIGSSEELSDPQYAHDSISDIAFRWGFSDISHFSRSFRSQFGVPPSEFRATSFTLH